MAKDNANLNINHVICIEGLISEIYGHLEAITADNVDKAEVKDAARNKLNWWETNELAALRKEFEDV